MQTDFTCLQREDWCVAGTEHGTCQSASQALSRHVSGHLLSESGNVSLPAENSRPLHQYPMSGFLPTPWRFHLHMQGGPAASQIPNGAAAPAPETGLPGSSPSALQGQGWPNKRQKTSPTPFMRDGEVRDPPGSVTEWQAPYRSAYYSFAAGGHQSQAAPQLPAGS